VSRALWFAAGAGVGVYAMTRARRAAEAFTPDGLADRLAGVSLGLHLLRDEVRAGAAEKENDLRGRLGLALPGTPTPELSERGSAMAERRSDNSGDTTREAAR
jgi:hypothetical protein